MGCDIHLQVERRADTDSPWELVPPPHPFHEFFGQRSYNTFAILANVRNGYGFAGVDTGEGFVPISDPRGLPEDASPRLRLIATDHLYDANDDIIWLGDHSFSYLTLRELMEYDWTQITTIRGTLSYKQYREWRSYAREHWESPTSWSGHVSGPSVVYVTQAQMDELIEQDLAGAPEPIPYGQPGADARHAEIRAYHETCFVNRQSTYCRCEWKQYYFQCCRTFLSECLPMLWRLGDWDNVRIVFGFDS